MIKKTEIVEEKICPPTCDNCEEQDSCLILNMLEQSRLRKEIDELISKYSPVSTKIIKYTNLKESKLIRYWINRLFPEMKNNGMERSVQSVIKDLR